MRDTNLRKALSATEGMSCRSTISPGERKIKNRAGLFAGSQVGQ